MGGFKVYFFTHPDAPYYNNIANLESRLQSIESAGMMSNLLTFYWDNENHHEQWEVPQNVIDVIRSYDVNPLTGNKRVPVYMLQGNFGIARVHASAELSDIAGTYYEKPSTFGTEANGGSSRFHVLRDLEGQTNQAVFAQFNGVSGAGQMRRRLYSAIIDGARAMGYWRDCSNATCQQQNPDVPPIVEQAWWDDIPNLRTEIDQLLPLIREPHWTSWQLTPLNSTGDISFGTRNYQGDGYLIINNHSTTSGSVTFRIEGLNYNARKLKDYFTNQTVTTINNNVFSVFLPGSDINQGTAVFKLSR